MILPVFRVKHAVRSQTGLQVCAKTSVLLDQTVSEHTCTMSRCVERDGWIRVCGGSNKICVYAHLATKITLQGNAMEQPSPGNSKAFGVGESSSLVRKHEANH